MSYVPVTATVEEQLEHLKRLTAGSRWAHRILHPSAKCVGGEHVGCGDMPRLVLYGRPYCERHAFIELASDG